MPFPILLDTKGQVAKDYGIRGAPAHFLIDRKGDIKAFAPGFKDWNSKESHALINYLMNQDN